MALSLRRNIRLRKEYLQRKTEEQKEYNVAQNKRKIKEAIEAEKHIPTELQHSERDLRKKLHYDDDFTLNKNIDDEYINAGVTDPKVCITTCRDPSSRLKQFSKEVRLLFPNSVRINRGSYRLKEMMNTCRENEFTDVVIVHEHRGEPDAMTITHLPHGPTATFTLYNVVMRHDIHTKRDEKTTVSEAYPHLIFDNFSSKLGNRVENILKHLFPVPNDVSSGAKETKRVISFINRNDFISFRHHVFDRKKGVTNFEPGSRKPDDVELQEQGPRFEMQLYEIKLGTIDQAESDVEWIRHFYMNTSSKRKHLSSSTVY